VLLVLFPCKPPEIPARAFKFAGRTIAATRRFERNRACWGRRGEGDRR